MLYDVMQITLRYVMQITLRVMQITLVSHVMTILCYRILL